MFQPVIDIKNGTILLNDGSSLYRNQNEANLVEHFGLSLQVEEEWGGAHYYFIKNSAVGDQKLTMNLAFFHQQLRVVSLYLVIPEELLQNLNPVRNGFGPSEKEYAELEIYEEWLTAQIGEQRTFSWGSIEALFAPRPDGPGEPLIHLVYEQ